jgi:hypothetical protein
MARRKNFPERKAQRREQAIVRNELYQSLTVEQKLAKLPPDGALRQHIKLGAYEDK